MGRYAKEPEYTEFAQPPAGTHLAVCYSVVDLGTQHTEFNGEEKTANQVLISWELPEETMDDGRPFSVSRFYTNSLHEKASLRKDLVAWRGRDFTQEELNRFDLASILGKTCLVSVVMNQKGKAKVGAVLAVPKGTPQKEPTNPIRAFFMDEWDPHAFSELPKGLQGLVAKSDEYGWLSKGLSGPPSDDQVPPPDDDDIPF